MKKFVSFFLVLMFALSLFTACSNNSAEKTNVLDSKEEGVVKMSELKQNKTNKKAGFQLDDPEKGEEIAVVETTMGTFKIRFFPEEAPKAVYNFKKLASQGYYNGLTFHRIMDNFMIQGGDPTGTGIGGDSIWNEDFEDEFNENLVNITGSLSMANKGPNTNSSQFFINYCKNVPDWEYLEMFYEAYKEDPQFINEYYNGCVDLKKLSDEVKAMYNEHGGNLHLDGGFNTAGKGHTVFGQVFEGLDVVERISKVETDENNKPLGKVIIKSITIEKCE